MENPDVSIPTNVKDSELVIRRRRQIVRAAMRQFAKKGFFKTSIRDIAKETGISLGAIYNYVRNKEEILVLNQAFFLETAGGKLRGSIQYVKDPLEKLRRLIRTELQMMDRFADYHLLVTITRQSISEKYSHSILQIERERLQIFDEVLRECVETGKIKECNIPQATKFIKVMIDSWINKQWIVDNSDIAEMEDAIFGLFMNGMAGDGHVVTQNPPEAVLQDGTTVLLINGTTPLAQSIAAHCREKGASLSISETTIERNDIRSSLISPGTPTSPNHSLPLSKGRMGSIDRALIREADVIIHDLGIGTIQQPQDNAAGSEAGEKLDFNLKIAQDLAVLVQEEAEDGPGKHLVYLAPWQWDQYANPIRFEIVKESVIGLTKLMAGKLATHSYRVHCIVPGYIRTAEREGIEADMVEKAVQEIPFGDLGRTRDVLQTISYLISDASAYSTGSVIKITGGMTT